MADTRLDLYDLTRDLCLEKTMSVHRFEGEVFRERHIWFGILSTGLSQGPYIVGPPSKQ